METFRHGKNTLNTVSRPSKDLYLLLDCVAFKDGVQRQHKERNHKP